ncbi:casein kinase I [Friedmanniomyces endolithicus]|nr:casein kinase I [Friedmanniomyces endolithicus]
MHEQRFVSTSVDPFTKKLYDRPINRKYVLIERLGKGGFGVVYLARASFIDRSFLEEEARKYEAFQDAVGLPKVYWFGRHDDLRVMAFELLGPTLDDLFAYCGHRFSLKTTLMIADQILVRLEQLPSNAVTDFGLADEYTISCAKAADKTPPRSRLVGTARFASIRGHQGQAQSPKDDLESLGYMIAFFLPGKLPWQGLQAHGRGEKNRVVMEKKMATSPEQLCEKLP